MPGTDKATELVGETPNAELEATNTEETTETEGTEEATDPVVGADEGSEDAAETEAEPEAEDVSKGLTPRERQLQLTIDRQGNELGPLRKIVSTLMERLNKAGVGAPTAEDWANSPDEAAKADKAYKDEQANFEVESRRAENRTLIAQHAPNFEVLRSDILKILQEDGASKEYVEAFQKNPHDMDPTLAFQLTKRAEERAKYRRANPTAAKPDQRKFTPTNDKAGHAPANVKGPMNYESLAKQIEANPEAAEKLLAGLSSKDINALIALDKQATRKR